MYSQISLILWGPWICIWNLIIRLWWIMVKANPTNLMFVGLKQKVNLISPAYCQIKKIHPLYVHLTFFLFYLLYFFFSQNALTAPSLTLRSWWTARGAWAGRTSNTSKNSSLRRPAPFRSERTKPGWPWSSTATTPKQSSTWTRTWPDRRCSGPSARWRTKEETPWRVRG